MAALKDITLLDTLIDDSSGKNLKRPGIQRLIQAVESGSIQAVIVYKLDRLTRKLSDLLYLLDLFRKHGVTLISIHESLDTETPIGRLMVNLIGSINEFERENITLRVKESLSFKASKNGCVGQVPYGYAKQGMRKDSRLTEEPSEQAVIARMRAYRASGMSLRTIADTLTAEGVLTRKGTAWKAQYIDRILRSDVMTPKSDMTTEPQSAVSEPFPVSMTVM